MVSETERALSVSICDVIVRMMIKENQTLKQVETGGGLLSDVVVGDDPCAAPHSGSPEISPTALSISFSVKSRGQPAQRFSECYQCILHTL